MIAKTTPDGVQASGLCTREWGWMAGPYDLRGRGRARRISSPRPPARRLQDFCPQAAYGIAGAADPRGLSEVEAVSLPVPCA